MSFNYEDIEEAYGRIGAMVRKTPLEESFYLNDEHRKVFFKLESMQRAKSFKIRGALSKMTTLTEEERKCGVATVSSGNHGSSVAYAASLLGIERAQIIVPGCTPQSKIGKIEHFGGEALVMGANYDEAHELGMNYIADHGLTFVDAYYDDPLVYAGQGTIGIELLDQNPDLDTVVVPVGGGGLITGIAMAVKAIKPSIRVVGVQTEACPAVIASVRDGVLYKEWPSEPSICDALIGGSGKLSFELAPSLIDEWITVSEDAIGRAVSFMAKEEKYVAEAGSCTTVAAIQEHPELVGGGNIALIISGGNIDGALLADLLGRY